MMIHIACNIDHNLYRPHCAVSSFVLFIENNPKETFTVHIIARELLETDRNILTALAGNRIIKPVIIHRTHKCWRDSPSGLPTIVCRWLPITDVSLPPIAKTYEDLVFGL